jgi:hypothetical protein
MQTSKILIRASSAGKLMTNAVGKSENMGETSKSYCKQLLKEHLYNRHKDIKSKYLEKGIEAEEDALTLYSIYKKKQYDKNTTRLYNSFVTGLPDSIEWRTKTKAKEGIDIKCPYDLFTLPWSTDKLNSDYEWQAQCYMWLTGAEKWTIVYCLMNSLSYQITREKRYVFEKYGSPDQDDILYQAYILEATEIEKMAIYNMKEFLENPKNINFDVETPDWQYDIPMSERIVEFIIYRDNEKIEKLKKRIKEARTYMKTLKEEPICKGK